MKDSHLERIMIRHMENSNRRVNIETAVMSRIKQYEEKKSARILYWQYILSAIVLCSGIASLFVIQYLFNEYSSYFELYWINTELASWISIGIFLIIILFAGSISCYIFKLMPVNNFFFKKIKENSLN